MTAALPGVSDLGVAPSDEEVVARVRDGELALYEILMRRHNQKLYRAVRAILRDESEVASAAPITATPIAPPIDLENIEIEVATPSRCFGTAA